MIGTQTTDSNGGYMFDGLSAGDYRVELTTDLTFDYEITTADSFDVTLVDGQISNSIDFGARELPPGTASISGLVFEDLDGDGEFDAGEPSFVGAGVTLLRDTSEILTVTTDSSGRYTFDQLREGQYSVVVVGDSLNDFVTSTPDSVDVQIADGDIKSDVDFGVEEGPNLISLLGPLFGPQLSNEVPSAAFFAAIQDLENVESFGRWTFIDTGTRRLAFYTEDTESANGTAYAPIVSIGNVTGGGIPGVDLTDGDGGGTVEDSVRLIGSIPLGLPDAVAVPFAEMALRGRPEEDMGNPLDGIPGVNFEDLSFQYAPSPSETMEEYVLEAASVLALGANDNGEKLALLNAFLEGNLGRNQLTFTWFFFADSDFQDIDEWQENSVQTFLGEIDTSRDVPVALNIRIDRSEVLRLGNVWAANELFRQLAAAKTDTLFRDDYLSQFETTSVQFATAFIGLQNQQFQNVGDQLRDAAATVGTAGEILVSLNVAGDIVVTAKEFYNADSVGERFFIAGVAAIPGSTNIARGGLEYLGLIGARRQTYVVNGIERTYGRHFDGFDYNAYLTGYIGAKPTDIDGYTDIHAHHILFKKGYKGRQQALVEEGQDILRRVGIDPIYGPENLVWAPKGRGIQGNGTHRTPILEDVVNRLKELDGMGGGYDEFVVLLTELGEEAAKR